MQKDNRKVNGKHEQTCYVKIAGRTSPQIPNTKRQHKNKWQA